MPTPIMKQAELFETILNHRGSVISNGEKEDQKLDRKDQTTLESIVKEFRQSKGSDNEYELSNEIWAALKTKNISVQDANYVIKTLGIEPKPPEKNEHRIYDSVQRTQVDILPKSPKHN